MPSQRISEVKRSLSITRTLIFPIASLHLLVHSLLHLSLQNPRTSRLVVVGDLENMRSVDPVIGASSHDMIATNIEFVHRDLTVISMRQS